MTDTLSGSKHPATPRQRRGRESGVGLQPHKRTGIDIALALLTPIIGQEFLDKYHLRDPLNRGLRYGVEDGVLHRRRHRPVSSSGCRACAAGPTRLKSSGKDYFDLTPDDDQKMIVETVDEFAEEILRPAAHDADEAATYPRRPDRQGRRAGHHRDQHPRGLRRHRRAPLQRDQRAGRRGAGLRRHGPGAADPGARRRRVRADPLGQRRPAGHLPHRVRRRERPAGLRGHRRAAAAVRPDPR